MKKVFKYIGWGIFALLVIGTFVYLFSKSRKTPPVYDIYTVSPAEQIQKKSVITGTIMPRDEVSIVPQLSGIVTEILCKPGDVVKAGDLIAKLQVVPSAMELSQAELRVEQAQLTLKNQKEVHARDEQLYRRGVMPLEEYQASQLKYKQAQMEVDQAADALNIVRTGMSRKGDRNSSTLVRATVSGVILEIPVRVGNSVIQANTFNAGTTIATIADMKKLIFKGTVDEIEVGKIAQGMPVNIIIGALDQLTLPATIEYISPKAQTTNGSALFDVEAAVVPREGDAIRAGMSANAEVIIQQAQNVLSVPEAALEFRGDSVFVQKVEAESPELRTKEVPVTIGVSDGVTVEIKSGLKKNDRVRGPLKTAA